MSWTAPLTAVAGNSLTAAQFNTYVRDNLNETEVARAFFTGNMLIANGSNSVRARSCFRDSQLSLGNRSSSSYGDLDDYTCTDGRNRSDNFGPAVTLTCNGSAVVWFSTRIGNSGSNPTYASIKVENSVGDTLVSPSDAWAQSQDGTGGQDNKYGVCHRFTALGSDNVRTFVMQYRTSGGTGEWSNRELFVMAL